MYNNIYDLICDIEFDVEKKPEYKLCVERLEKIAGADNKEEVHELCMYLHNLMLVPTVECLIRFLYERKE